MDGGVVMFTRLLVAVPMEQFTEKALVRARDMSVRWGAEIAVLYVIEDNILNKVSDYAQHVITGNEEEEWQHTMEGYHRSIAEKIFLDDAEKLLGKKADRFTIVRGMYSDMIRDEMNEHASDLLLLETFPRSFIKLRILDSSPVPIWLERTGTVIKKIGLFCTNANPNVKAPPVARDIAEKYGGELCCYFINDPSAQVKKDLPREIAGKHSLSWNGFYKGRAEHIILKTAEKEKLDCVVIGRVQTYRLFSLRRTISRRIRCNVLFIV
jgi:nucleotide-binding universal stress UspA family protein